MLNQPLVSVIIPLYNAENYIAECVKSVLNQTWQNKEIIIVDDGSTDNSVNIIKLINDSCIKLVQQKNQGASSAKQTGLGHAKGYFIQYLDADDILHPDKLTLQVNALIGYPDKISIGRTVHFFNDDINDFVVENETFYSFYLNSPLHFLIKLFGGYDMKGGMIQPNAFLTPRNLIDKAGPWNTSISPCADEDGEYFCRVILQATGLIYQHDALNYYRKNNSSASLSGRKSELSYSNLIDSIWLKHGHLLKCTDNKKDITFIHNATFRCLDEVLVQIYFAHPASRKKILNYQKLLNPSILPGYYVLGGRLISWLSKNISWKIARLLQHYNPFK